MCYCLTMRPMRKRVRKKCECFVFLLLICGISFMYAVFISFVTSPGIPLTFYENYDYLTDQRVSLESNLTRILLWTGMFGNYNFSAFEIGPRTFKNCPAQCEVTFDKRLLLQSAAVIFHVRDVAKVGMPSFHLKKQMWIFYLQESSENTCLDLHLYKNVFNWTMTHRMDSDIYHPYSRILPVTGPPFNMDNSDKKSHHKQSLGLLAQKPKLIAWVASNCYTHSNRESFVREIQKYVPVDIFGKCGDIRCPGESSRDCYATLAKTYKFYFAFENSLCTDYITEKFFDSLHYDIVPVVYGDGNYSLIAPPGSYIDARGFDSPKGLANYLLYLDSHPEIYLKYFSWKDSFRIVRSDAWCKLCVKLKSKFKPKTYSNIWQWWHTRPGEDGTPACLPYPDYPSESWFTKFRKRHFFLQ